MNSSEAARAATRWLLALSSMGVPALAACPPEECPTHAPSLPDSPSARVRVGVPLLSRLPLISFGFTGAAPDSQQSSTVQMIQTTGGHAYSVKIQDGKTSATIDDQPVPEDRIRRGGNKIDLLDEKGEVVASFEMPDLRLGHGQRGLWVEDNAIPLGRLRFQHLPNEALLGGQDAPLAMANVQAPPVMLGITMGKPEEGAGVMVDSVLDGLPAAKAGIKVGDRITRLDAKEVVGRAELRNSLMDFKPGQEITLEVQREGKTQEVKVKLEAFEPKRLEPAVAQWRELNPYAGGEGHDEAWYQDALKKIATAQASLKDSKLTDDARRLADQALDQACKSLQEAREKAKDAAVRAEEMARAGANDWLSGRTKLFSGQRGGVYVAPAPGADDAMDRRLEELDRKMERILERQDRAGEVDLRARNAELEQRVRELERRLEELRKKSGGN